ncbi:hypothetical protein HHI36_006520 [Cryptolaemus montrouzieri]
MQNSRHNYASLQEVTEVDDEPKVLVHTAETSRTRWNHIEDLDSFLKRVYEYHQGHGFMCILLQEIFDFIQFIFIIFFSTILVYGIEYPILFKDKPLKNNATKVTLSDVIKSPHEIIQNISFWAWVILTVALFYGLGKVIRSTLQSKHFYDMKQFYNTALKIEDKNLDNLTWHDIQKKVILVQTEQSMCVHKRELTELDIYHRILRQRNYFIAMVNKSLIPPRFNLPFLGEIVYWTQGLQYNVKMLLFQSPWGPFKDSWHLREEYRKVSLKNELAQTLKNSILWLALINVIFCPLIFMWQLVYIIFENAEIVRREPNHLSVRHWSPYGRMYLSHFNELDHELNTRLMRAHRLATRYLAAFTDPLGAVIARYIGFMAGAILAVIIFLTIYDEDVLGVEHLLSIVSILGVIVAICRSLIPDETIPWCPDTLLSNVLAHTHYLPHGWKGQAHTTRIRTGFQQLFQLRSTGIIEELLSPVLTPLLLAFYLAPRSQDIVNFFYNFTVSVTGVGDVCSFAQMDIRKHGNPEWHDTTDTGMGDIRQPDQYTQGEEGKVELSLIHFTHTNPSWKPPPEAQSFVDSVHVQGSVLATSMPDHFSTMPDRLDDSSLRFSSRLESDNMSMSMHRSRIEGPSDSSARDMSFSTKYLHDRHNRLYEQGRVRVNVQENTPLLFNH